MNFALKYLTGMFIGAMLLMCIAVVCLYQALTNSQNEFDKLKAACNPLTGQLATPIPAGTKLSFGVCDDEVCLYDVSDGSAKILLSARPRPPMCILDYDVE